MSAAGGEAGCRAACESAWGQGADRRPTLLISQQAEGSYTSACSQMAQILIGEPLSPNQSGAISRAGNVAGERRGHDHQRIDVDAAPC
jgi:hypothetical protein